MALNSTTKYTPYPKPGNDFDVVGYWRNKGKIPTWKEWLGDTAYFADMGTSARLKMDYEDLVRQLKSNPVSTQPSYNNPTPINAPIQHLPDSNPKYQYQDYLYGITTNPAPWTPPDTQATPFPAEFYQWLEYQNRQTPIGYDMPNPGYHPGYTDEEYMAKEYQNFQNQKNKGVSQAPPGTQPTPMIEPWFGYPGGYDAWMKRNTGQAPGTPSTPSIPQPPSTPQIPIPGVQSRLPIPFAAPNKAQYSTREAPVWPGSMMGQQRFKGPFNF